MSQNDKSKWVLWIPIVSGLIFAFQNCSQGAFEALHEPSISASDTDSDPTPTPPSQQDPPVAQDPPTQQDPPIIPPPIDGGIPLQTLLDDMRLKNDLPWAMRDPARVTGWDYGPGYISQGLMYGDATANWYTPTDPAFRSASMMWPSVRPWWVVWPGEGHNGANDFRVHIRNYETYLLYKSTGRWVRVSQAKVGGGWANWYDERQKNVLQSAPRVVESDGMISFQAPPGNNCMHGGSGSHHFESNPTDVIALHTRLEVRLVGSGAASKNIKPLFHAGADYATVEFENWEKTPREDSDPPPPPPGDYLPGVGSGRLRLLTPEWQTLTFTTVKPDAYNTVQTPHNTSRKTYITESELKANLPPGITP